MNSVRNWFTNGNDGIYYDIYEDDGHLKAKTDTIKYLIVEPHEGNGNRWLLRISTIVAFDRWANSRAIEKFFDTETELCEYLTDHQLEIYRDLIRYLSDEYDELERTYISVNELGHMK